MSDIPPPPPPGSGFPQPAPPPGAPQSPPPGPPPGFGGPGSGGPGFGGPGFGGPIPATPSFGVIPAPRRSGKAIASLVLGIAGVVLCFLGLVSLLALIFGILAFREIGRSQGATGGRGMAIAGVVLGAIGLLLAIGFWVVVRSEIAGTKSVGSLEVGDCVELPEDGEEISRIDVFDCSEPHGAEVIAVGDIGQGDEEYPGDDVIAERARTDCLEEFEDVIGVSYFDSVYEIFPITPIASNWDDDQEYICLAFEPGEQLTESIEGANR